MISKSLLALMGAWVFSTSAGASGLDSLANAPQWQRLLHYKSKLFAGVRSEIPNDEFFLSVRGKTDPLAELSATIEAFESGRVIDGAPAACVYPARFKVLDRALPGRFQRPACAELDGLLEKTSADSISLIFSGYFQGSPASMFGHTFLRLNRGSAESPSNLAIDYSAMIGNDSMLLQAPLGLFGFYEGAFNIWPYYVKVKEYNNAENRDLYEYDLNFSRDEVDLLLRHLVELRRAKMNYYFTKRNCSYEILALIEVAKPDWQLTTDFRFHAIPVDTVRSVVHESSALRGYHARPSIHRRLLRKWEGLSDSARAEYFAVIRGDRQAATVTDPALAEALGLHYAIQQIKGSGHLDEREARIFHGINLQRSRLPALPEESAVYDLPRPDQAHETMRWSLGVGGSHDRGYIEPGWRLAIHELIERDSGLAPNSALEFFKVKGRIDGVRKRVTLEELTLARSLALNPLHALSRKPSYEISAGLINIREDDCLDCLSGQFRVGVGAALNVASSTAYFLAATQLDSGSRFQNGFRIGPGARVGWILPFSDRLKFAAETQWSYFFAEPEKRQSVFWTDLALGYAWSSRAETHIRLEGRGERSDVLLVHHFYH